MEVINRMSYNNLNQLSTYDMDNSINNFLDWLKTKIV